VAKELVHGDGLVHGEELVLGEWNAYTIDVVLSLKQIKYFSFFNVVLEFGWSCEVMQ